MNPIALVVFSIAIIVMVGGALYGAIKTPNGRLGILANLSIPLWFVSVIIALAVPQYPGYHPHEIIALVVVLATSAIVIIANKKDNEQMMKRIKK